MNLILAMVKGTFWDKVIASLILIVAIKIITWPFRKKDHYYARVKRYKKYINELYSMANVYTYTKTKSLHIRFSEAFMSIINCVPHSKKELRDFNEIKSAIINIGKLRLETLDCLLATKSTVPNTLDNDGEKKMLMEANELKRLLIESNQALLLFLRANYYYDRVCNEIEDAIGECDNTTACDNGETFVTLIKSKKSGDLLFLMENKGLVAIARGMNKESEKFYLKNDCYWVLSSEPKCCYVIDFISMGKDAANILAILLDENDEVIKEFNRERGL